MFDLLISTPTPKKKHQLVDVFLPFQRIGETDFDEITESPTEVIRVVIPVIFGYSWVVSF